MYLLKSIKIDQFRGKSTKSIKFFPDINFLIGENGSGKTTILKIVLGLLTGNLRSLFTLPFRDAEVKLADAKGRRSADIIIRAHHKTDVLEFSFQQGKTAPKTIKIDYEMTQTFKEHHSHYMDRRLFVPERWDYERNYNFLIRKQIREFEEFINKSVAFDDLSVERLSFSNLDTMRGRERDFSIDKILEDVIRDVVAYFKDLSLKASQKDDLLKETYVMSLLVPQQDETQSKLLSADMIGDKLKKILSTLGMKSQQRKELNEFLTRYSKEEKNRHWSSDSVRMKRIIDVYDKVEQEKKEIFQPRDIFLDVLKRLLKNKEIQYQELKETEEPFRIMQGKTTLLPSQLSSGEKHLLILLGKTLLQKNTPRIFIADEPEISLHIQWQRKLVGAIRLLNQNAQIVFATHSPEIVAGNSDKLHNLSEIV